MDHSSTFWARCTWYQPWSERFRTTCKIYAAPRIPQVNHNVHCLQSRKGEKNGTRKECFSSRPNPFSRAHLPFSPFISPFVSPSCRTLPKRPADHTLAKPYRNGFFTGKGCGLLSSDFCSTVFSNNNNNNNNHAMFIIFQEMLTIIKLNLKVQGFCFFLGLSALQSIPSLVTLTNSCYMTPYLSITYLIIWTRIGIKTFHYLLINIHRQYMHMLFAVREVRIGKNCARGLEYGPSESMTFEACFVFKMVSITYHSHFFSFWRCWRRKRGKT